MGGGWSPPLLSYPVESRKEREVGGKPVGEKRKVRKGKDREGERDKKERKRGRGRGREREREGRMNRKKVREAKRRERKLLNKEQQAQAEKERRQSESPRLGECHLSVTETDCDGLGVTHPAATSAWGCGTKGGGANTSAKPEGRTRTGRSARRFKKFVDFEIGTEDMMEAYRGTERGVDTLGEQEDLVLYEDADAAAAAKAARISV